MSDLWSRQIVRENAAKRSFLRNSWPLPPDRDIPGSGQNLEAEV